MVAFHHRLTRAPDLRFLNIGRPGWLRCPNFAFGARRPGKRAVLAIRNQLLDQVLQVVDAFTRHISVRIVANGNGAIFGRSSELASGLLAPGRAVLAGLLPITFQSDVR